LEALRQVQRVVLKLCALVGRFIQRQTRLAELTDPTFDMQTCLQGLRMLMIDQVRARWGRCKSGVNQV
jgi:hypothetical protein